VIGYDPHTKELVCLACDAVGRQGGVVNVQVPVFATQVVDFSIGAMAAPAAVGAPGLVQQAVPALPQQQPQQMARGLSQGQQQPQMMGMGMPIQQPMLGQQPMVAQQPMMMPQQQQQQQPVMMNAGGECVS
jgi:hypothetical protein